MSHHPLSVSPSREETDSSSNNSNNSNNNNNNNNNMDNHGMNEVPNNDVATREALLQQNVEILVSLLKDMKEYCTWLADKVRHSERMDRQDLEKLWSEMRDFQDKYEKLLTVVENIRIDNKHFHEQHQTKLDQLHDKYEQLDDKYERVREDNKKIHAAINAQQVAFDNFAEHITTSLSDKYFEDFREGVIRDVFERMEQASPRFISSTPYMPSDERQQQTQVEEWVQMPRPAQQLVYQQYQHPEVQSQTQMQRPTRPPSTDREPDHQQYQERQMTARGPQVQMASPAFYHTVHQQSQYQPPVQAPPSSLLLPAHQQPAYQQYQYQQPIQAQRPMPSSSVQQQPAYQQYQYQQPVQAQPPMPSPSVQQQPAYQQYQNIQPSVHTQPSPPAFRLTPAVEHALQQLRPEQTYAMRHQPRAMELLSCMPEAMSVRMLTVPHQITELIMRPEGCWDVYLKLFGRTLEIR
ncbi:hypothetical protein B0A50_04722 [Salinomyces thailandicus]|uniref:Uncharacterized protein n=1 Tax=Salinomyces thailandicus TaxID=706561 RepID=A0A4U0TWE3_9PEZI|nr:hypothetical protein B0A50_04722 [Salinomyces thailandica]